MKIYSIYLPRYMLTKALASWLTNWKMGPEQSTRDHLDELWGANDAKFSLELSKEAQTLEYCYSVGSDDDDAITAMIHSIEPGVETIEISDPAKPRKQIAYASVMQIGLQRPNVLPLDTYIGKVAGCASMVNCALCVIPPHRRAIMQLSMRRKKDSFFLQASFFLQKIYWLFSLIWQPRYLFKLYALKNALTLVEERRKERLYEVALRIAAIEEHDPTLTNSKKQGEDPAKIQAELDQHIKNLFYVISWHNRLHCNKVKMGKIQHGVEALIPLQERSLKGSFLLGTPEVTAFWHISKHVFMPYVPFIVAPQGSPPKDLPTDLNNPSTAFIGKTIFRDKSMVFGIDKEDRRKHTFIIGKSGVGKTSLLRLLIKSDIDSGAGLALFDPDGTLADDCLKMIPKNRAKDVVIFDPTDSSSIPCFNPLADINQEFVLDYARHLASLLTVSVDKKKRATINQALSAFLKDLMLSNQNTLLTLRERLLNRDYSLSRSADHVIQAEISKTLDANRFLLLGILSSLLANSNILEMFDNSINKINIHQILKERKIFIVKLPIKILGAQCTTFLGSLLVYKIHEAVMAQAAKQSSERYNFSLFIDAARYFATEAMSSMLNEARKYGLAITVTTQYLAQIDDHTRKALLANFGNIICFRTTNSDAVILAEEFKPRFADDHMINLPDRRCYIKMMIGGHVQEAFSAITLDLPKLPEKSYAAHCRKFSNENYGFTPKKVRSAEQGRMATQAF